MRPLALLTTPIVLLVLQQLVSIWFLVDFFLARDSSTADNLRKDFGLHSTIENEDIDKSVNDFKVKLCPYNHSTNKPSFDKLILIVIDALGSEFIPTIRDGESTTETSAMPFLEKMIRLKLAMSFIAKAATPTVTMPRLKAMVSGTIPSFMDIIYNLATDVSDFHDDNVLRTAWAHNKSLVFYGDDTWLSLFNRDMFIRAKETFSFFASDYTAVDTNVTEMALPEVEREQIDWDYLILHYLGLDHIGHVFGSNDVPLIREKLLEMDTVIMNIHSNMNKKKHRTLIIVCGDHGMSREGNHGGDTNLETNTAMIFIPINLDYKKNEGTHVDNEPIQQIDLAVTLSLLTGMSIPKMSRGVAIKSLLQSLWYENKSKTMCAILENVLQLAKLADKSLNSAKENQEISNLISLMKKQLNSNDGNSISIAIEEYFQLAKQIQSKLIQTIASKSNQFLVVPALILVMFLSLANMRKASFRLLMPLMTSKERLSCLLLVSLPIFMQGSTDYIEMEHIFWPIYSIIVFLLFCLTALQIRPHYIQDIDALRVALFIITFMITATWNNLAIFRNYSSGFLTGISILIMSNFSRQTSKLDRPKVLLFYATGLVTFVTKIMEERTAANQTQAFSQLALLQICAMLMVAIVTFINIWVSFLHHDTESTSLVQKLATSWMWLAFLLSRSHNYIFLISNVILETSTNSIANSLRLSPITRTIIYSTLSSNAFYGQGNSNLFSSLDVKPAFYGQTMYNIYLAVPLVACATFSTQIYWYIKLFQRVQGEKEQERMSQAVAGKSIPEATKDGVRSFVDMRNFLSLGYYMFVCMVLRNHLFIWSVISPKLVYHYVSNLILQFVTLTISNAPLIMRNLLLQNLTYRYNRLSI